MTAERIAEARRRCQAATKPPWAVSDLTGVCIVSEDGECPRWPECDPTTCERALAVTPYFVEKSGAVEYDGMYYDGYNDAAFKAAARTDLPDALDDLEAALAVARALCNEREAKRHFFATKTLPTGRAESWQVSPEASPLLRAWSVAEDATNAALAALGEVT